MSTVTVDGTEYEKRVGSRAEVYHGTAYKTKGGLTERDLVRNDSGRIVSKKRSELSKVMYAKNGLKPRTAEEMAELRARRKPRNQAA